MMSKCPICGSEEIRAIHDWVPYGSTNVSMQTGEECSICGEEIGETLVQVFVQDSNVPYGSMDALIKDYNSWGKTIGVKTATDKELYVGVPKNADELDEELLDDLKELDGYLDRIDDSEMELVDDGQCYNTRHKADNIECHSGMGDCVVLRVDTFTYNENLEIFKVTRI